MAARLNPDDELSETHEINVTPFIVYLTVRTAGSLKVGLEGRP